jgi:methyltransferase
MVRTSTRSLFLALLALLAGQRLLELRLSRRNTARMLQAGGYEHGAGHFRWMRLLHIAWFGATAAEVVIGRRPFRRWLANLALLVTTLGQCLRYAAIHTLGPRWTVRVITLPAVRPESSGIYRFIRHPNYLGVVLEIAAVPLVHGAYLTSLVFSLANALLLYVRIRVEEQALEAAGPYAESLRDRPRFLPQWLANI